MNKQELMESLNASMPHLKGTLRLERVYFDKKTNTALIALLSDVLVGQKDFLTVKARLRDLFPNMIVHVHIATPSLGDDFLRNLDAYKEVLHHFLCRQTPAAAAWLNDTGWSAQENGSIRLTCPDEFCFNFYKKNSYPEKLTQAIYDIFRISVPVELSVAGERERWLQEIRGITDNAIAQRELDKMPEPVSTAKTPSQPKPKPPAPKTDVLKGRSIGADNLVAIKDLSNDSGIVAIEGTVFAVQPPKELRGGESVLLTFTLFDDTDAIYCKVFYRYRPSSGSFHRDENEPPITQQEKDIVNEQINAIKNGLRLRVRGDCAADHFMMDEICITVRDMVQLPAKPIRQDTCEEKRVELHMHTNMSEMDALTPVDALISRAAAWGHPAVAVTDHGCTQAFPAAFAAAKKNNIKLIPGIEGYLCDLPDAVKETDERRLDQTPIVILDFETTGLSHRLDRIIEIGAVRMLPDGTLTDRMSLLCNPGVPLRQKIIEITNITDAMLQGQPTPAAGVRELLDFIGNDPVAAHNADFDMGMLQAELQRMGLTFHTPVLDTLTIARKLYPELSSHKLESVCRRLHISNKGAHRAVNDAEATARCLYLMLAEAREKGAETFADLNRVLSLETIGSHYHIVLLCKNRKGMQNLNHIISDSNLKYFSRRPNMPRKLISQYREGLIVGSACIAGELLQAMLNGKSEAEIEDIASFYDYLEIQPIGNNAFMLRDGSVTGNEELRELNRRVVRLAKKLGKPVVATGDVHFMDPEDAIFRSVIQAGQGFDDFEDQPPLYFKTTNEMLDEFSYLGKDIAHEVVIEAPRKIAELVEPITLYPKHPEGKETFQPLWPEAANDIETRSWTRAKELYGDPLPEIVQKRLEKELGSIIGYGFSTLYSIAQKLVSKSLSDGYLVGSRGSVGSSFVATMCGITEVNPLPPHYRCDHCHKMFLTPPELASVGVDLPDANCEICGNPLKKDGYDIPFEVFLGFKGDKVPDIDLNFSGEYQPRAHAYIEELFGEGYVYRAGTISGLKDKTAFGYAAKYCERKGIPARRAQKEFLASGCTGVKRTTGQHPGGIVVLPKEYDICEFTAVQHPANDKDSPIITTHFDFRSMHDILVKLDCLGHDDPTMIHRMEALTNVPFQQIPLDDPAVISLFKSPEALGVTAEEIECRTGTLGVPEFGTNFVIGMLCDTNPSSMEELIRISGVSHGTDVWLGNAQDIINQGIGTLRQCFCTRDDIMNFLISRGVADKMSFDIMESVRKGKGLKPEMEQAMIDAGVPDWAIGSCKKIKYMFPRGHAVAYVTNALRIAWYKVHYPLAYYAAYFSIRDVGFDAASLILPTEDLRRHLHDLINKPEKGTDREAEEVDTCKMLLEMNCRGIRMLPLDLYKSDVHQFTIEDGNLRCPFTSVSGFPESTAQSIVAARGTPFTSQEDLKERAHVGETVMKTLQMQGALAQLPTSSQMDLFSML